jgi:hypothetical protein
MKIAKILLEDGKIIVGYIVDYDQDYFQIYNEEMGYFWINRKLINEIKEVIINEKNDN